MKFHIISRLLGILLLLESLAMMVCGGFGTLFQTGGHNERGIPLFISGGITILVALILMFVTGRKFDRLPKREGIALVGLSWLFFGFFGAIPFMIGGPQLGGADAFFEAISGFTTTGSTVIEDLDLWPRDILLWRATTQWFGGLGILVLFVALLSSLGAGTKFLFHNESSFKAGESSTAKIHDIASNLLKIYLAITLLCTLGLMACGMTVYEAVTHAITTVSTGGFSIYNESIAYFDDWQSKVAIQLWISLFMIASSVNFLIYLVVIRRRFHRLKHQEESFGYLLMLLISTLAISPVIIATTDDAVWWREGISVFFTIVSVASSCGFGLADYEEWPTYAICLMVVVMVIGGSAGSTAGGMKMGRFILFLKATRQSIIHAFRPNQYLAMKINNRSMDPGAMSQIILFIALYFCLLLFSPFVVAVFEAGNGISLETAVGSVIATLCNIGPGLGEVGPTDNFAHLQSTTKLFLCLLMILGRLELFALLALLVPETWKRF